MKRGKLRPKQLEGTERERPVLRMFPALEERAKQGS